MATQEQLELRKKWVAALRSGEYKQTQSKLFDGEGYCCLGVACVVAGIKPVSKDNLWYFNDNESLLPFSVKNMFGLSTRGGVYNVRHSYNHRSLSYDNDKHGLTFDQIADIIEYEPEGLFEGDSSCANASHELTKK